MPSEVDIVNLALSHLGDDASVSSISPPEASTQAQLASQYYPIARKALLEMHPWGFATKRDTATAMTTENDQWDYAYAIPSNCVKVISVIAPGSVYDDYAQKMPFAVEARADGTLQILTNQVEAEIVYIDNVTNTNKFPALFILAFARLLASYLAGPIIKGDVGRKESVGHLQIFQSEFAKAAASDVTQSRQSLVHNVPWLAGRA